VGKLTKDEEAALQALQAKLEEPDEVLEVWVEHKDGPRTKLTGSRAEKWLRKNGLWDDDDDQDDDDDDDPEGGKKEPEPKSGNRYFR
jgi:hypothetical protein